MTNSKHRMFDKQMYVGAFLLSLVLSIIMALLTMGWEAFGLVVLAMLICLSVDFTVWVCSKLN